MSQSSAWITMEKQYYAQTVRRQPVVLVRGRGCHVWDADGTEYLELIAGWAVNNLGHAHPAAGVEPTRSRPCYVGIAEHCVYVERSARGTGAGRMALTYLCRLYTDLRFWKLVSRIFPENTASLALHERVGFRVVGMYRRHGKVDGVWRDCVIVEKLRGDAAAATLESNASLPARSFV